ncbi:MAG: hypothetical protein IIZ66_01460 [Clostridia bacterium]|nr:hypothetical protein [Clostridia bacterium]
MSGISGKAGKKKAAAACAAAVLLVAAVMVCLFGRGKSAKKYTVGEGVAYGDITEFYSTYYNINYGALYVRYRFYAEDGKLFLEYEKRERPDGYGPLTEDDRTEFFTRELTDAERDAFFGLLKGGTVAEREDGAESGDSGPWYYLYRSGDREKYREFTFESAEKEREFSGFCGSFSGK